MTRDEFLVGYQALLDCARIEHFRAVEFCDVGRERDGVVLDVPPPKLWADSLTCWRVLEWLRAEAGAPIIVTSGYRSPAYNRAVGGAMGSKHLLGIARDITVAGRSPAWVADTLESHPDADTFGIGRYSTFTHVDTRGHRARWGRSN